MNTILLTPYLNLKCNIILIALVYEILYDGVYHLKDLSYAVDKMLHDKVPSNHIEYFMSENVERRKKQKERAKIFIEAADDDKDRNNNALALKCKHHTEDLERASLLKESLSIFVFNRSLIQLENVCMNCLNVNSAKDLLDNGITPFPYKVAKALDPDIYRNIEFDVWSELRRGTPSFFREWNRNGNPTQTYDLYFARLE